MTCYRKRMRRATRPECGNSRGRPAEAKNSKSSFANANSGRGRLAQFLDHSGDIISGRPVKFVHERRGDLFLSFLLPVQGPDALLDRHKLIANRRNLVLRDHGSVAWNRDIEV